MDKLTIFINRMKKLNIDIGLAKNVPWIYIDSINGKRVKETFEGEHGFTIAFIPVRVGLETQFTDEKEIFKLIREYLKRT